MKIIKANPKTITAIWQIEGDRWDGLVTQAGFPTRDREDAKVGRRLMLYFIKEMER